MDADENKAPAATVSTKLKEGDDNATQEATDTIDVDISSPDASTSFLDLCPDVVKRIILMKQGLDMGILFVFGRTWLMCSGNLLMLTDGILILVMIERS